jgi:hypothetical protein
VFPNKCEQTLLSDAAFSHETSPMPENRVEAWWLFLCVATAFNIFLWSWAKARSARATEETHLSGRPWQLWLSFIYVVVCGFRSVLPRVDVERLCLFDTWLSSVAVGRTLATVAEMACVLQWHLLLSAYGRAAGIRWVERAASLSVGLIAFAELCSWYAVLSTHFLGNVMEESCWAILGLTVCTCLARLGWDADSSLRRRLSFGVVLSLLYFAFMAFVDVPMYVGRWQQDRATGRAYLGLGEGLIDAASRRIVSWQWNDWSAEIPWMTLYFTVAVWVMVSLVNAPAWKRRPTEARVTAPSA